jgi:hypothetical protein
LTPSLTGEPFRPAPLDSSSLNQQYDQPSRAPAYTAPPRPHSPAGYPEADPFVCFGSSSLRTNDRSYAQPPYPSSHGDRYPEAQEDTRSSRPASPLCKTPTRLPR